MDPRTLARDALGLHAEHMADPAAAELYVLPRSIPQANRLIELGHLVPDLATALVAALDEADVLQQAVRFADEQGAEAIERTSRAIVADKWKATAVWQSRALTAERDCTRLREELAALTDAVNRHLAPDKATQ